MNYSDIWSSQPFDMVSMTSSINKMEYAENFFEKELDWTVDESSLRTSASTSRRTPYGCCR